MSDQTTRRRLLQGTGTAAVLLLAGCAGDDGMEDQAMNETMADESTDESMENETMGETDTDEEMMDETEGTEEEMMAEPVTVTVRIENVASREFYDSEASTGGAIWITPGAYAVHTGANPIFSEGDAASIGLEAQAEAGPPTGFEAEPGLVDELEDAMEVLSAGAYTPEETTEDPNDPMGEVPGAPPIAPEGAFEFEIEAEPGQRLSFASMFVPSNDLFFSPETGIPLWPEEAEPVEGDVTDHVELYDAGTEPNGEPGFGPDQAPAQERPDQGADEGGVVRPVSEVDDGYDYPAVADAIRVTLSPQ